MHVAMAMAVDIAVVLVAVVLLVLGIAVFTTNVLSLLIEPDIHEYNVSAFAAG